MEMEGVASDEYEYEICFLCVGARLEQKLWLQSDIVRMPLADWMREALAAHCYQLCVCVCVECPINVCLLCVPQWTEFLLEIHNFWLCKCASHFTITAINHHTVIQWCLAHLYRYGEVARWLCGYLAIWLHGQRLLTAIGAIEHGALATSIG